MRVFYIQCRGTANMWSRNRWATPFTIPDLYVSEANAQRQIDTGKAGRSSLYHIPVVREGDLSL